MALSKAAAKTLFRASEALRPGSRLNKSWFYHGDKTAVQSLRGAAPATSPYRKLGTFFTTSERSAANYAAPFGQIHGNVHRGLLRFDNALDFTKFKDSDRLRMLHAMRVATQLVARRAKYSKWAREYLPQMKVLTREWGGQRGKETIGSMYESHAQVNKTLYGAPFRLLKRAGYDAITGIPGGVENEVIIPRLFMKGKKRNFVYGGHRPVVRPAPNARPMPVGEYRY